MNRYQYPVPSEYPAEWKVPFVKSKPLAAFAEPLKRESIVCKAGSTNPPLQRLLVVDVLREKDIPIPLRDGTVIYADVMLPADSTGPVPALVAWSPYGKGMPGGRMPGAPVLGIPSVPHDRMSGFQKFEGPDAAFWVAQGYALVHPDARGAWNSEGDIYGWEVYRPVIVTT